MARTWLSIRADLVSGHGNDLWPRPGRILAAARSHTFAQPAESIDDAFARWDHAHLHLFTLADSTPVTPLDWWDGEHPDRNINAMIAKAEKSAAGQAPMARVRFLKVTGETKELNQETVERARQLAELKGYVTNIDPTNMDGAAVILSLVNRLVPEFWACGSHPEWPSVLG
ncbi:hypothetical protein GCM10027456_81810 [Kineosporia babensis]|uniref:Uncharacterized protein n=1 Tax=Kineosporia babensis TaxID=499548 RepID=A0A9X1SYI1_9ACTN|nr:hypothetical protein [Kineosporia babensis]MCD5317262.1 hypothetical protein [Kineosporia babensis]